MKIVMYTTKRCPYCISAKAWLKERGHVYEEVSLDDPTDREEFKKNNPGLRTVPQIFVDDELVGGFTDLIQSKLA